MLDAGSPAHPENNSEQVTCTQSWEALRGDSLAWLLDEHRPNLLWRALVELVGRPMNSPAVRRARGGANAAEPVASLLAELHPDGRWATEIPTWSPYKGPGWRLVAAVAWGADPEDPRLHAASELLLETAPGEGGLESREGSGPSPRLTVRALEAMVALGWGRHPRVQEWLAWFEATTGWEDDALVAVAVVTTGDQRPALRERAVEGLHRALAINGDRLARFGHPNLLRTDLAEIFSRLAMAGIAFRSEWRNALVRLQRGQGDLGRWPRTWPVPETLRAPTAEQPSRWITLKATRALLAYAVDAELPRLFPYPPKPNQGAGM